MPIILVPHTLDPTRAFPRRSTPRLTFNSNRRHDLVLQHERVHPGRRSADRAPGHRATGLATGRYSYSVQIVDERSSNTTTTYSGTATVLNQSSSTLRRRLDARGPGADHIGVGRRDPRTWATTAKRSGSREAPAAGAATTPAPAGDFSTLTLNSTAALTPAPCRRRSDRLQFRRLRDRHDRPQCPAHHLYVQRLQ